MTTDVDWCGLLVEMRCMGEIPSSQWLTASAEEGLPAEVLATSACHSPPPAYPSPPHPRGQSDTLPVVKERVTYSDEYRKSQISHLFLGCLRARREEELELVVGEESGRGGWQAAVEVRVADALHSIRCDD